MSRTDAAWRSGACTRRGSCAGSAALGRAHRALTRDRHIARAFAPQKQTAGGRPPAVRSLVIHHIPAAPHARARRVFRGCRVAGAAQSCRIARICHLVRRPPWTESRKDGPEKATAGATAPAVATRSRTQNAFVGPPPSVSDNWIRGETCANRRTACECFGCGDAQRRRPGADGRASTCRRRRR